MSKIKLEDLRYVGAQPIEAVEPEVEEVTAEEVIEPEVGQTESEEIQEEKPEEIEESTDQIEEGPENAPNSTEEMDNITTPVVEKLRTEIVKVKNLRIYSKPSTNSPAKSFTGNVEIIGHVESFTIVKYVKAGFGSVKGYTLDI